MTCTNRQFFQHFLSSRALPASVMSVMLVSALSLTACNQVDSVATNTSQTTELSSAANTLPVESAQKPSQAAMVSADALIDDTLLQNVSATVYKDANCGCCKDWITHAENHGMNAMGQDVTDLTVFKQRYGVPANMQSCHTAVTEDGYVFEGHVPAKYVAQFLDNPPAGAIGLAVPGMPMGSPGMEYNDQFDPYQIMQINQDGSSTVYANIETPKQQR